MLLTSFYFSHFNTRANHNTTCSGQNTTSVSGCVLPCVADAKVFTQAMQRTMAHSNIGASYESCTNDTLYFSKTLCADTPNTRRMPVETCCSNKSPKTASHCRVFTKLFSSGYCLAGPISTLGQ